MSLPVGTKRVLLTGGTGFVGARVARTLLAAGYFVRVLARRTSRADRLNGLDVELVHGDLADRDSLREALQGMEALVNLATTMSGPEREMQLSTIEGTKALFDEAIASRVSRIVHMSSIAVLPLEPPNGEKDLLETAIYEDREDLRTAYVVGKQASEKAAVDIRAPNVSVAIIRPGVVYGPGGHWKLSRLGFGIAGRFFVIGDGSTVIPCSYVENLADAVVCALERDFQTPGIFHVIDDEKFTQRDYLEKYSKEVDCNLKVTYLSPAFARILAWCINGMGRRIGIGAPFHKGLFLGSLHKVSYSTVRAKTELGWFPRIGKTEAMDRTMRYFRNLTANPLQKAKQGDRESSLRVAIVGCGAIARSHLQFLLDLEDVQVVGCYDVNRSRAEEFATEFKIPLVASSIPELIRGSAARAVHVLTPPQFTFQSAMACIEEKCHVLVEKPMALNAMQARQMAHAAENAGVVLCVDHNHVFDQCTLKVKERVRQGDVGDVIWVESYYGFDLASNRSNPLMLPDGASNWNFSLPGGLFQNLLPHPLSVALEFLPNPVEVSSHAGFWRVLPHQPNDELRVMLNSPTGCGLVTVSLAASPKFQTLTLYGTKGIVFADYLNKSVIVHRHLKRGPKAVSRLAIYIKWGMTILFSTVRMTLGVAQKRWVHYDGMQRLIRAFANAASGLGENPVPTPNGVRVVEIMDTVWTQIGPQTHSATRLSRGPAQQNRINN